MPSEEEMIELLIFNKEDIGKGRLDFRWIHSREFKYNGDMYDIVEKKETDEQLIVTCINDTKEKKLEEEFEKRVHRNSTEEKQRPSTNSYNFVSLSEPVQPENAGTTPVCESKLNYWLNEFYRSIQPDIPSPPPRFA